MIKIFTDGACRGNGRPDAVGAYAFIILRSGQPPDEGVYAEESTPDSIVTNNIMELKGCLRALARIYANKTERTAPIEVITDSKYIVNGITLWVPGWKRNSWRRWDGDVMTDVKNQDLWKDLDGFKQRMALTFTWVRGHNGDIFNERCDLLCRQALDTLQRRLQQV
jgi:ribonuclease HI